MRPLIEDEYRVNIVAISCDSQQHVARHRERDGISFPLLSDPKLEIIRQFGLVHQKGLAFQTFNLLGVPLGWPTGFRRMAIPTTLLIDEQGMVRWIDQAEDYRQRGDETRISQALAEVFGEAGAVTFDGAGEAVGQ